uniref:Uncharacterized protein n=1 Tax=Chromera velia CCMP2878 TaxID=1169474 RepID=A0A0G4HEK4_9ALVE|eukprot:Cvel_6515.t1-p1 / transcript=Cvel_6515.t1 / gene=Cvel_6515 / organism=Chromera_velia_CCMP2878 / gene_product=hypothetical protein / transcript_product=hypothetical protein / location=Cvel_scaffold320:52590-53981(-) / protein_length=464 / sequence_SO=supercontig / SO=protein_coding / is_pseudo=false
MTSTWNPLQPADAWMHRLCLALYAPSLQSLKELRLEGPGILQSDIRILAKTIGEGRLQGVEVMEVETSAEINDDGVVEFAGALRGAVVPLLGRLRLSGRGCQEKGVKALLAALSSADRPPIQTLHVSVRGLGSEEAEGICSGKYSEFLTSLEVLDGPSGQKDSAGKTFAEAALRAEKPLPLYVLEMDNGSWHVHSLMVASLFVDLLGNQKVSNCLKRLKILCSTEETEPHVDVFRSLLCAKLPQLRTLHVENTNLTEADAMPLNEALQKDLLPSLQSLNILGKSIGRVWMEGFGQAVSEGKLVGLEHLCLTRTRVGEGLEFLTVPLGRGSLPRLSSLCLPQCCVNDRGMAALAGAIRTNDFAELTKLRLDGNPFGEEGLRAFAEAILGRPTTLLVLQSLFFGSPQGNWEGRALATGLNAGRLPSLKTFILSRALQNRQPGESEEPLPMVAFKSRLSEKNNDFRA